MEFSFHKVFPISSNVVQAYKKQQELEAQHDLKDRKWCTWKQLAGIWLTNLKRLAVPPRRFSEEIETLTLGKIRAI